jgi:hypothetical protein
MSIVSTGRALLSLLQPITGNRSTGTATVRAVPGPTAVLPRNAYAVPIVAGAARWERMLKVAKNPAQDDGHWDVAAGGTPVSMISMVGGAEMNLAVGTKIRWWPTLDGIEPVSTLTVAATGATEPTGLAALKQVAFFEELRPNLTGAAQDLFRSMVTQYPAAVLTWETSDPADGSAIDMTANTSARVGRGIFLYQHAWDLFIISSRTDSDPQRREEGLAIVEAVTELLQDATTADGEVFSNPNGVRVVRRQRQMVSPNFYVYRIGLVTVAAMRATERRSFHDWVRTRLDIDTPDAPPLEIVDNNLIPMP